MALYHSKKWFKSFKKKPDFQVILAHTCSVLFQSFQNLSKSTNKVTLMYAVSEKNEDLFQEANIFCRSNITLPDNVL